jgi:hypothetical protein
MKEIGRGTEGIELKATLRFHKLSYGFFESPELSKRANSPKRGTRQVHGGSAAALQDSKRKVPRTAFPDGFRDFF